MFCLSFEDKKESFMKLFKSMTLSVAIAISVIGCSNTPIDELNRSRSARDVLVAFTVDESNKLTVKSFPRKSELGICLLEEIVKQKLTFGFLVTSLDGTCLGAACASSGAQDRVAGAYDVLVMVEINNANNLSVSKMRLDSENRAASASDRVLVGPFGEGKSLRSIAIDSSNGEAWLKPRDKQENRDERTDLTFAGSLTLSKDRNIAVVAADGLPQIDCVIVGGLGQISDLVDATLLRSDGFADGMFVASFDNRLQMIVDRNRRQVALISPSDDPYFVGHEIAIVRKIVLSGTGSSFESSWRAYIRQIDGKWAEQSLDAYRAEMNEVFPAAPHSSLFSFHSHATLLSRDRFLKVLWIHRASGETETKCSIFDTGLPAASLPVWVVR